MSITLFNKFLPIPILNPKLLFITSIVAIFIGLCLIIYGLIKGKKTSGKSKVAWVCISIGSLIIINHIVQILIRIFS